jgi:hypothetical protein
MKGFALGLAEETREVLFDSEYAKAYKESEKDFTRNRKMGFVSVIGLCLNMVRKSMQLEIDNYMELLDSELEKPITKQAFSKARQKISPCAFQYLFEMTGERAFQSNVFGRYKGRRVFALDGSELYLPKSKDIIKEYGMMRKNSIPYGRASVLCDVITGYTVHSLLDSLETGERKLAMRHLDYFLDYREKDDIVEFDRGYASNETIKELCDKEFNFVMRLKRKFNVEIDNTNKKDFFVNFEIEGKTYKLRVIKFDLSSGEKEVLITNLSRTEFKHSEFAELYHLRWGVETKYNTLKNKLDIENFSGKTVTSVLQDFYATLYLSNMAVAIKAESDEIIKEDLSSKNLKYDYITNENLLIGKLKNNFVLILLNDNPDERVLLFDKLIERISHFRTPIKPNRSFNRNSPSHKKVRSIVKKVL